MINIQNFIAKYVTLRNQSMFNEDVENNTEKLKERMITHGKSKEKIYQVYQSMQTRINYTGDINYHNY